MSKQQPLEIKLTMYSAVLMASRWKELKIIGKPKVPKSKSKVLSHKLKIIWAIAHPVTLKRLT